MAGMPKRRAKRAKAGRGTAHLGIQALTAYWIGKRVEIHPAHDLWIRGARYGDVVGVSRDATKLRIKLDKWPRIVTVPMDGGAFLVDY